MWATRFLQKVFALCDPLTIHPKIIPLVGYPNVILYTKFEHFGIIRFRVIVQTVTWTHAQTDANKHFTPVTVVGVSNNFISVSQCYCLNLNTVANTERFESLT